ncbi:hypothetical protein HBA51_03460 [Sphingopyxis terrae subsp. terrae]|nr:hypothetical protein HBA51_03460 [Sphingopyxis terrae subsp. terrae]
MGVPLAMLVVEDRFLVQIENGENHAGGWSALIGGFDQILHHRGHQADLRMDTGLCIDARKLRPDRPRRRAAETGYLGGIEALLSAASKLLYSQRSLPGGRG